MQETNFNGRKTREGFLFIQLEGSPYEMGLVHGEILREEIKDFIHTAHQHVLYGQPGFAGWGVRNILRATTALVASRIPKRYRQELSGIAKAANVSYKDLLFINCFDDVIANLRIFKGFDKRFMCSAFALTPGDASEDIFCGRNLDYFVPSVRGEDVWTATNYLKEHLAVIEYAPQGRSRFLSVGWPGFIGVVTGINERGLTLAALSVLTSKVFPFGTPSPFLYRRIMERAATLADAHEILRRGKRMQGHSVLLTSGSERAASVVEYTPRRIELRYPANNFIAETNHYTHLKMEEYNPKDSGYMRASRERFERLEILCGSYGKTMSSAVQTCGEFLLDTMCHSDDEYSKIWNPATIYSTIFASRQRKLWLRASDSPTRTFQEIMLSSSAKN